MLIGIDVGGTYTDAVLLTKKTGQIIKSTKVPTQHNNLLASLVQALDAVLVQVQPEAIQAIQLSTTIVTNIIAEKKYRPVGLILIPGPGLIPQAVPLAAETIVLTGSVDHRGRVTGKLKEDEIRAAGDKLVKQNITSVAVVGKFSVHNHQQEVQVAKVLKEKYPQLQLELGHRCGPLLNFPRRAVNTVLTAAAKAAYQEFAQAVQNAVQQRQLVAPIMILKADGGTLPLTESLNHPVETIFSGPAASVLGALSLTDAMQTGVVVDIGGTTTDLALILDGRPLMASKGVAINGNLTQVRSFAINALPLGGDSEVVVENHQIVIRPERKGSAACMGGPVPTPTDALRLLNKINFGCAEKAQLALEPLAKAAQTTVTDLAEQIIKLAAQQIVQGIEDMFQAWQEEPAYRVWELLQKVAERPNTIIGVGGGSAGLVQVVAEQLGAKAALPSRGEVANAIGAAVALPTVRISLRADTDRGTYQIEEEGYQGSLESNSSREKDIAELGRAWLTKRAARLGIAEGINTPEIINHEIFNIVRGSRTAGAIHHLVLETPWQISHFVGGEQ